MSNQIDMDCKIVHRTAPASGGPIKVRLHIIDGVAMFYENGSPHGYGLVEGDEVEIVAASSSADGVIMLDVSKVRS